jgi:hypothetical protein
VALGSALKWVVLSADHYSKRSAGRTGDTSCASVPADTAMNSSHDEGSTPERGGAVRTLQRVKSPEVKSLPKTDSVRKPLVAFEALPATTAAPLTWDSDDS